MGVFDALPAGLSAGHPAQTAPPESHRAGPETVRWQAIEWEIPVHT